MEEKHCAMCQSTMQGIDDNLKEEFIYDVADFFKVFGDSTRIKLLHLLLEKEMCVGDIADKLDMTQSAVSHQLRVLRQSELVKYRKEGKTVYYSLDDSHVENVLRQGIGHIKHKKGY
ncbi:MAG: ArsR/SmtB family transcription factor [Anaerotignaceae bacterium]